MITVGLIFAALSGAIHVYIFVLEAFLWTAPRGRATFGTSVQQAEASKSLALNQGFYNLFLAVITAIGIVLWATGNPVPGAALVFSATGSMVAAGLVLISTDRSKTRAALIQLVPPAISILLLIVGISL